jgi:hypothetical protein
VSEAALRDLAAWINDGARELVTDSGGHPPMVFVRQPDGAVSGFLLPQVEGEPRFGPGEVFAAARSAGGDAVVVVSEVWAATPDTVPFGGRARDSPDRREMLVVAAVDRDDNAVLVQTPLHRAEDGSVLPGESEESLNVYDFTLFDAVKQEWRDASTSNRSRFLRRLLGR